MDLLLARIKDDVIQFADVISKTLDVDVLIVDNNLKSVGNTVRYFDKYDIIRRVSVIGQVITTGEVIAIDDKSNFSACKVCPDFYECEMCGLIGVPIFYRDCVVGAIALILPKQKIPQIFKDVRNSIEFLKRMADLLSSKLQNSDDYTALRVIKQEREVLMDAIEDAIVSTDNIGYISYHNKQFEKYFGRGKSCVGQLLHEIIPHKVISDFLDNQVKVKDKLIFTENREDSFYGLVSCNNIIINGRVTGMLFTLKPVRQINSEFSEISGSDTKARFARYEQTLFPRRVVEDGKRLAVTNRTILIQCAENTGDLLLARCIHNFSDRNRVAMLTVDCHMARDLQEQAIFGELGQLHMAHRGTLFVRSIEALSFYLQRKLASFLKDRVLVHEGGRAISVDARLIFSSTADLKGLADNGAFFDELYYRIAENTIHLEPLRDDRLQLRRLIESNIAFFKEQYHKPDLYFADETLRRLYRYDWPQNLFQVESVVDLLVYKCDQCVTEKDLETFAPALFKAERMQSIDEIEKEKIAQLLRTNHSKDDVARILGISRATLYRKIKQYKL